MRAVLTIFVTVALALGAVGVAISGDKSISVSAVEIVSHSVLDVVEQVDEVVIRSKAEGIPVVLVRAAGDSDWWVQRTHRSNVEGESIAQCHFGNSKTADGTRFEMVVLIARTNQQVVTLSKQQVFKELPDGLHRLQPVVVVRGTKATKDDSPADGVAAEGTLLEHPANNAEVGRRQKVIGAMPGEFDPVVLVRSAEVNSLWWVQDQVSRDEAGEFTSFARFGNDKTPSGSRFHLMIATPRDAAAAATIRAGTSFKRLPDALSRATEIVVVLVTKEPAAK